jgi:hypothetical protein
MWSLHVRRRVLWDLLLNRWWRDVLLRRSGASLPCPGHTERIADAWLALRWGSRADATGCLQLLLWLGRSLLILDWHGWRRMHW